MNLLPLPARIARIARIARFAALLVALVGCSSAPKGGPSGKNSVSCEIGIIGGGPAGLYAAYRLADKFGERLCLFEKEERLGGRMKDETLDESVGNHAVWVGTGARRVNIVQKFVLDLGRELGVEFQPVPKRSQLIQARGRFGYSPDDFISAFPGLKGPLDQDPSTNREDELYALLLSKRSTANRYANFRDYVREVAGEPALGFLSTVSRFHADWSYDVSAASYLEYLSHEIQISTENVYPVGGMSAFVRKMEAISYRKGVRIYQGEPVLSFEEREGGGYWLKTPRREVTVKRLIVAAPPAGFDHIQGKLAEEIRRKPEYQALIPIRTVVINQWWDRAWWSKVRDPKTNGDSGLTWRAWSLDTCVNHVEIPQEAYLKNALATRSVYTEDPRCVKFWEDTLAKGGIETVEAEVMSGLAKLFDHRLTAERISVPKPRKTTMHVWPGGWYYVRAGTKQSNSQIAEWSIEPLPGKTDLMLVGEAYWVNRPGWSEGAYFSVDKLLDRRFGILPRR